MAPTTLIDSQHHMHLRRSLMASAYALVVAGVIGGYAWVGYVPVEVCVRAAGAIVILIGMFLGVFRFGINRRFRDRSLTMPQCMAAIVVLIYVNLHVVEARAAFSTLYLLPFMFGLFRMRTLDLFVLALPIVVAHGAWLAGAHGETEGPAMVLAAIEYIVLTFALTSIVLIGGYLGELRRRLRLVATRDPLTGLANRREIEEMLAREKFRVDRSGPVFCVAVIDIDQFMQVKDTHGHSIGDRALREFGDLTQHLLRKSDYVGRFGGDEFLVIMTQTNLRAANHALERLVRQVREHHWGRIVEGLGITISVGVAECNPSRSIDDVLKRVEDALYVAKQDGRCRVVADSAGGDESSIRPLPSEGRRAAA